MPLLDAYIPKGALEPSSERALIGKLTDILLELEGLDPGNELVRSIAWVFLHRPAGVFVGGVPAELPRYRIVAYVPEGQYDAERRNGVVRAVTDAILDAEPSDRPRDASRVWVFPSYVPEGTWGGGGRVLGLADIARFAGADPETAEAYAKHRLGLARAERDAIFA